MAQMRPPRSRRLIRRSTICSSRRIIDYRWPMTNTEGTWRRRLVATGATLGPLRPFRPLNTAKALTFRHPPERPHLAKPDPYDQKHIKTKNNFYWRREHCLCEEFARRYSVVSRVGRFEDLPI